MKANNLLFALLSIGLLYSCTDDTNIPVANEQEPEVTNTVSLNAAKDLLEDFVGEINARSGASFTIK